MIKVTIYPQAGAYKMYRHYGHIRGLYRAILLCDSEIEINVNSHDYENRAVSSLINTRWFSNET